MNLSEKKIKVFTGNAHPELARGICTELGLGIGEVTVRTFADGEINVTGAESVRGCDVFIIQPTCPPHINDNLMELLVMIDAFRRASAYRITAVIPYFGYARQDRKAKGREPITAKLIANLITSAGADRVLTMDLHASQIQGFFDIPVDNLYGKNMFVKYYMSKFDEKLYNHEDFCVVSPDIGSVARSRAFAADVHMGLAIVDKRRPRPNVCEVMNVIGDVQGKTCIIYDDIVDTAGTLCQAAETIKSMGAKAVYACATHGVLSKDAVAKIENSCLEEMVFLNTIPLPVGYTGSKIRQLDAASVFARAMKCIWHEAPISNLLF